MEEKLNRLYNECLIELKTINIDITDKTKIGEIDIKLAKRNSKRYGCCKQEKPDTKYYHYAKRGSKKIKVYDKFQVHHIEISKWVMELDDKVIKNTIMHEIIHCMPNCNNHGKVFKLYANYINENLHYNIKRLGNKEEDYKNSNIEYEKKELDYKYKIRCKECGYIFLRQRIKKNFLRDYRCGKCKGKLQLIETKNESEIKPAKVKERVSKPYYTYMLRCEDNSIYTGMTTDIERRMREHFGKTKKCAKYTNRHTAKRLEGVWQSKNRVLASKLEFRIKQLSKSQKEELIIKNNLDELLAEKINTNDYTKIYV